MNKENLQLFNSALYTNYQEAFRQTKSAYEAHVQNRAAIVHFLETGSPEKFVDEPARLNIQNFITREEVARLLADDIYNRVVYNEPKTGMDTNLNQVISNAAAQGVSEAAIMKMLQECLLGQRDKFYAINKNFIMSNALRSYELPIVERMKREQIKYEQDLAKRSKPQYQVTNVRVNRELANICRDEIRAGVQIKRQNEILQNNIRNGRTMQRPRRNYSVNNELFATTDIGMVRQNQEDSVLILTHPSNPDYKMLVVADGVGGYEGGENASYETVYSMMDWFEHLDPKMMQEANKQELVNDWTRRLEKINSTIRSKYPRAGSTFVGAIVGEKSTSILSVGDSRAYMIDNNMDLRQLTVDDNIGYQNWNNHWGSLYRESKSGRSRLVIDRMIDEKDIDRMLDEKDKVRFQRNSNVITGGLGLDYHVKPNVVSLSNSSYKTLMLLSDGVTDCISDKQLMSISRDSDPALLAQKVVDAALVNKSYRPELDKDPRYRSRITPGKDNATAAVYHKKEEGESR